MKLYYVANARMPNEKAHGIQIAKMCEALLEAGAEVTLVAPSRARGSLKDFYGLRVEVPVVTIAVPDLYLWGPVGYGISSAFFICFSLAYLWYKRARGERFAIYTVDIDTFSHAFLPLAGRVFAEMHSPKRVTALGRFFFARAAGIVATNKLIAARLRERFNSEPLVAPNGVDYGAFALGLTTREARTKLGLPEGGRLALYVGRLYRWKGLEILPQACARLEGVTCRVVGGTAGEFAREVGASPGCVRCEGARDACEVPLWLQAADVLLVLGTAKNEESSRYTSPMKLFEYMASGRPIVASSTPALQDILSGQECFFYEPDDAESLARAVGEALTARDASARAARAQERARSLSWASRAQRVLAFVGRADTLNTL